MFTVNPSNHTPPYTARPREKVVAMTSFIQTMFVQSSPPQYPASPKPLPAIQSNVLVESESHSHLQLPSSPDSTYQSPLHRQLQTFFSDTSTSSLGSQYPSPTRRQEQRLHEAQRGLGYGLAQIAKQADLFTHNSNSNARNRQTFQSQKRAKGTSTWQLKQFADATLGGNSLRKCVQLPEGEDRNEWLAVNGTSPPTRE